MDTIIYYWSMKSKVPGYGVLNGTDEQSEVQNRPFFAFRSVFYAEQPTAANRFLVRKSNLFIDRRLTINNELLCINLLYLCIKYKAAGSESPLSYEWSPRRDHQQFGM